MSPKPSDRHRELSIPLRWPCEQDSWRSRSAQPSHEKTPAQNKSTSPWKSNAITAFLKFLESKTCIKSGIGFCEQVVITIIWTNQNSPPTNFFSPERIRFLIGWAGSLIIRSAPKFLSSIESAYPLSDICNPRVPSKPWIVFLPQKPFHSQLNYSSWGLGIFSAGYK